jgi:hypothetical protein
LAQTPRLRGLQQCLGLLAQGGRAEGLADHFVGAKRLRRCEDRDGASADVAPSRGRVV